MKIDYIILIALFLLGVAYHIMQRISVYRKKYIQLGFKTIWATFFGEEWDSLIVSGLVLITVWIIAYVLNKNWMSPPAWVQTFGTPYIVGLILGYCGQRLAYKYLGTAEEVLDKKDELFRQANGLSPKPQQP